MRKFLYVFVFVLALSMLFVEVLPETSSAQTVSKAAQKPAPTPPPPAPGQIPMPQSTPVVMWINHLDFLPGDPSVITSFNALSDPAGHLSGLVIESTTTGEIGTPTGNKVVEKGLEVPPGYLVKSVRVCYELSNARSFISQIRLDQVQNPPSISLVLLDDGTDLTNPGPVCVDSQPPLTMPTIDPAAGGLRLSFRVNFGDIADFIVIRSVGLTLLPDPNSFIQQEINALRNALMNHAHIYLTGKGVGHNNVQATTSLPRVP